MSAISATAPIFTEFGTEDEGWDIDGNGGPGIGLTAKAVQVWAVCQPVQSTIGDAATAFNLPLAMIAQAVEYHPYMYLDGPADNPATAIGHDGE
ncbi:hypothetical protein IP70_15815 [alpha proteobacterium AAP38]|nr:hypothetical protein IP70_15815 [alpha proteobacterium AAP38]